MLVRSGLPASAHVLCVLGKSEVESREYLRMQMHVETVMQQALISVINGALPADRACCAVSFNREGMV